MSNHSSDITNHHILSVLVQNRRTGALGTVLVRRAP